VERRHSPRGSPAGVRHFSRRDVDEIDDRPDTAAPQCEELEDSEAGVAQVETIHSQAAQKDGEDERRRPTLGRVQAGNALRGEPASRFRPDRRIRLDLLRSSHLLEMPGRVGTGLGAHQLDPEMAVPCAGRQAGPEGTRLSPAARGVGMEP
jgi:hypothetical protein